MKKLPPFGKNLFLMQQQGIVPTNDIFIFVGRNAWQKASNFHISRPTTTCLPPYHGASFYAWPVKDCDVIIFDTSMAETDSTQDYLNDLAFYLYEDGARIVRCATYNFSFHTYKRI